MIKNIQRLLKTNSIESWLLVTAENKDPYFKRLISPNTMGLSIALITQNSIDVFVHSLDVDNLNSKDFDSLNIYNSKTKLEDILLPIISKRAISQVSLNYTTLNDFNVDVLGHGTFLYITEMIKKISNEIEFISSEKLIYGIYDIKSEDELIKMSIAAKRALEILMEVFAKIKVGMSEKEVATLTQNIFRIKPKYFKEKGVIKEDFSWNKDFCPIVLTGDSFIKGGHAVSSDNKIIEGNTVYFDFGVKLTFKDGSSWSSDIQRTGYVLAKNEETAPKEIQSRFNIIRDSISLGIKNISPNMKGYEVDDIVRGYIKSRIDVDYDHATGHAIGELAHNPGTIISNRRFGLSDMFIQENGVYTIEPRIPLKNGVSIEEMVVVKPNGKSYTLCDRQMEIIYING